MVVLSSEKTEEKEKEKEKEEEKTEKVWLSSFLFSNIILNYIKQNNCYKNVLTFIWKTVTCFLDGLY